MVGNQSRTDGRGRPVPAAVARHLGGGLEGAGGRDGHGDGALPGARVLVGELPGRLAVVRVRGVVDDGAVGPGVVRVAVAVVHPRQREVVRVEGDGALDVAAREAVRGRVGVDAVVLQAPDAAVVTGVGDAVRPGGQVLTVGVVRPTPARSTATPLICENWPPRTTRPLGRDHDAADGVVGRGRPGGDGAGGRVERGEPGAGLAAGGGEVAARVHGRAGGGQRETPRRSTSGRSPVTQRARGGAERGDVPAGDTVDGREVTRRRRSGNRRARR